MPLTITHIAFGWCSWCENEITDDEFFIKVHQNDKGEWVGIPFHYRCVKGYIRNDELIEALTQERPT
jgi:hypothetical protein